MVFPPASEDGLDSCRGHVLLLLLPTVLPFQVC